MHKICTTMWSWWCEGFAHFNFSNRKGAIVHSHYFHFEALPCLACVNIPPNAIAFFSLSTTHLIHSWRKSQCQKTMQSTHTQQCELMFWVICLMLILPRRHTIVTTEQYKYFRFLWLTENLLLAHFEVQVSPVWHRCQATICLLDGVSQVPIFEIFDSRNRVFSFRSNTKKNLYAPRTPCETLETHVNPTFL